MKLTKVLPNAERERERERERAITSVWWPGLSRKLEEVVNRPPARKFCLGTQQKWLRGR